MGKSKDKPSENDSSLYKVTIITDESKPHGGAIKRPLLVDDVSFEQCEREFRLDRCTQTRKSTQLRIQTENDRIRYEGVNFGRHSAKNLPYKYAVAILDGDGAQIFEPELFVCSRVIKKQESISPLSSVNTEESTASEYVRSRMLLGESFGTKRTKQLLSSMDRHKINIEQLVSQSNFISKNIDTSARERPKVEDAEDVEAGIVEAAGLLPPHNKKTTIITDVYRIQDLMSHEVYHSLQVRDLVEALDKKDLALLKTAMEPYRVEETVESRFTALASLAKLPDTSALTHLVRCLIYLNHLLHFRALNETKLNGDLFAQLPMATEDLISHLLSQFAECIFTTNGKKRFKLSNISRDRLIVHACILALTLDGFRTNVVKLSAALKLGAAKMGEYFKSAGCTLERPVFNEPTKYTPPGASREIQVKFAVLKAPLKIQPTKVKKGHPTRK